MTINDHPEISTLWPYMGKALTLVNLFAAFQRGLVIQLLVPPL